MRQGAQYRHRSAATCNLPRGAEGVQTAERPKSGLVHQVRRRGEIGEVSANARQRRSRRRVAEFEATLAPPVPQLRCWQDARRRDLHLACNAEGAQPLIAAVEQLAKVPGPSSVTLPLTAAPLPDRENPVAFCGVERVFSRLRLQKVADATQVWCLYARKVDAQTAEIRLGSACIDEFLSRCHQLIDGRAYDIRFDSRPPGVRESDWKKLRTLDRESVGVWFWAHTALPPERQG